MADSVNYRYWSGVCRRQAALTVNTRTRQALREMAAEFLTKAEVHEPQTPQGPSLSEKSSQFPAQAREPNARIAPDTLAQAQRRVAKGQQHINHQETILADLERRGSDTRDARRLLSIFRGLQTEHLAHRERLLNVLAKDPSSVKT